MGEAGTSRVLITGVPGWLGSRLVETLVSGFSGEGPVWPGWRIRLLTLPGAPLDRLKALSPELQLVAGDLRRPDSLVKAVEGVSCIFHLAGLIHPRRVADLYAVNTGGTRNLLSAARCTGVKRFVYVSSNSTGGFTRDGRLMEESDPPRPYMAYGRSKYLAERSVAEAARRGEVEGIILRPCWYYGPGQPERQTRFFRMIKRGRPFLFGDGKNLRSLTYLDNLIQAILLAGKASRAVGQVYWISDERSYTTLEIYQTVAELLGVWDLKPLRLPGIVSELCMAADAFFQSLGFYQTELHVAGEMNKDIACSIDRARRELGYSPRIGLREGMRRSIEWCRATGIEL